MSNIANKRIAVTQGTWETMSGMRNPGQTFSELCDEMILDCQTTRLDRLSKDAEYVPWDEAKKRLDDLAGV